MKQRYQYFRRENGIYYSLDTLTRKRQSLETTDAQTARRLANALNEACKQPAINLQIARVDLQHSDPEYRRFSLALAFMSLVSVLNPGLSVPAAFAADETCASCGQQVSLSGDFVHRTDDASVTIEGVTNNATAFHEEIGGTNFTVTIAHLPAGKYTIVIGEVETLANAPGERLFDMSSSDVTLATNFEIVATAGGAKKVCYINGLVEHEDDSIKGPLKISFLASKDVAKFNTFEGEDASGASVIAFSASELAEPFSAAAVQITQLDRH